MFRANWINGIDAPCFSTSSAAVAFTVLNKLEQFFMPETCENWLGPVNTCVYYARQIRKIYLVFPYSAYFKVLGKLWNSLNKTILDECIFFFEYRTCKYLKWPYRSKVIITSNRLIPIKFFDTDYALHMVYIIVVSGSMDLCMMKTFNYFRNFSAEKWRKYKYIGPSEQFITQRVK